MLVSPRRINCVLTKQCFDLFHEGYVHDKKNTVPPILAYAWVHRPLTKFDFHRKPSSLQKTSENIHTYIFSAGGFALKYSFSCDILTPGEAGSRVLACLWDLSC